MLLAKILLKILLCLGVIVSVDCISNATPSATASLDWTAKGRETGLPIPRFVSLKTTRARMRIGPAFEYAVKWLYQAPGLPLEITEEYGNWRQVRDCDGVSGWMHQSLLSGKRTAMVGPWLKQTIALRIEARENSFEKAKLEPRVRVRILSCTVSWCDVALNEDHIIGFIEKSALWGVYPQEVIN
ncbi:SH3 domain-containing protein [Rhizobium ruizarguesonis]|uniref:SH3 domain-containing protein n=1 Tax=Rhizobium ruizarguesonis TaxID=2081791 RepID=UPI0013BF854B|nr:SH3 domain-containing protein [Rhizobium ruizarguesonis]NEJ02624.1 hypothetical protein [Rhizobium ruizarguesonis]NEJ39751.1 hypothetical protein [Rhizobium ruizarguesonis]